VAGAFNNRRTTSGLVWLFLALLLLSLRVGAVASSHLRTRAPLLPHTHLLLMLAAHLLLMMLPAHTHLRLAMLHLLIHRMRPLTGTLVFH
jgi:hypothetical protein